MSTPSFRAGILNGAGYAGGELLRLLLHHPHGTVAAVSSRQFAGKPVWAAHTALRGQTDLTFSEEGAIDVEALDVLFIAAEHGKGAEAVAAVLERGYEGRIVDLSADFRFRDAAVYPQWFHFDHPAPALLPAFQYGLPELFAPYAPGARFIANPGCFATGLTLALAPPARHLAGVEAHVTALTGASGSGSRPKEGTHYPTRDGNVRAYKVLAHQHLPEVLQSLGSNVRLAFVPVSGPWTRGIWGTAHVTLPEGVSAETVGGWFADAYATAPFVRCWPGELPEMRWSVGTPFCDLGWVVAGRSLVVGFALDNLLKGAASQAVQNLNLLLGLPETAGLLPHSSFPA